MPINNVDRAYVQAWYSMPENSKTMVSYVAMLDNNPSEDARHTLNGTGLHRRTADYLQWNGSQEPCVRQEAGLGRLVAIDALYESCRTEEASTT